MSDIFTHTSGILNTVISCGGEKRYDQQGGIPADLIKGIAPVA